MIGELFARLGKISHGINRVSPIASSFSALEHPRRPSPKIGCSFRELLQIIRLEANISGPMAPPSGTLRHRRGQ